MSEYVITIAVETEPGQGSPDNWDWSTLIDTPLPVGVVSCVETTGLQTHDALRAVAQVIDTQANYIAQMGD